MRRYRSHGRERSAQALDRDRIMNCHRNIGLVLAADIQVCFLRFPPLLGSLRLESGFVAEPWQSRGI